MNIKRYLRIVRIDVSSLFHRSVIVILKSNNFDFKTEFTATICDFSYRRYDFNYTGIILKSGKFCIYASYKKGGLDKLKIKTKMKVI